MASTSMTAAPGRQFFVAFMIALTALPKDTSKTDQWRRFASA
jgi:hypothetical protein